MQGRARAKYKRTSKDLLQVASKVSDTIGIDFLRSMVQNLCSAMGADVVYGGEFVGGQVERVRVLAISRDSDPDSLHDYELAGSASADAALGRRCVCKAGARAKFPEDAMLAKLSAEAFVGIPLTNANHQALGILMAVYHQPIRSFQAQEAMLDIFAPRATAELIRKRGEEQLRESEERYRTFIASNPDGMWRVEYDPPVPVSLAEQEQVDRIHRDGYIAECNDALARLLGRTTASELIGCRIAEFEVASTDPSVRGATLAAVRVQHRQITVETHTPDTEGKRQYRLRSQWGIVENGLLRRTWGSSRDITELRKSKLELAASKRRIADLLEAIHLVVVMLDLSGSITSCNDYFLNLTGWDPDEIKGKKWFDLMIPPEERDAIRSAFEAGKSGASIPVHLESTLLGPEGQRWWIAWNFAMLSDAEGNRNAAVFMGRNSTDYKDLEEQFRQAQKMESVGRLASGVAHDFNNILQVILGYAGTLRAQRDPSDPAYKGLAAIEMAAEKGRDLAHQLLTFSRRQPVRAATLDLNELIGQDQGMLRPLLGGHIELATRLDPELWPIRGDATQLSQVLMNLAVNARDAMPTGGRLIISSSNVVVDGDEKSPYSPRVPHGSYVLLTVTDTGTGMTEGVRSRLFEPFFTTKPPGIGTGLGLSTVYGIVQQSGGHIVVETKPNHGSTFLLFFPKAEAAEPAPKAVPKAS